MKYRAVMGAGACMIVGLASLGKLLFSEPAHAKNTKNRKPGVEQHAPSAAQMSYLIDAAVHHKGARLQVFVNGVELYKISEGSRSGMINDWIKSGTNTIKVALTVNQAAKTADKQASASVKLRQADVSGPSESTEHSVDVLQKSDSTTAGKVLERRYTFTHAGGAPSQLWSRVSSHPLGPQDRQQIKKLVLKLQAAVAAKDIEAMASLLKFRNEESARSTYNDSSTANRAFKEAFANLAKTGSWQVSSVTGKQLALEAYAEGSVVAVSRSNGEDLITVRTTADEGFSFDRFYVAFMDGAWQIVR